MRSDSMNRRRALGLLVSGLAFGGCCCRSFAKPAIAQPAPGALAPPPFLGPPRINKALTQDVFCVDAHAHFFNASDVTVKGFLAGPVAHTAGGGWGDLIRLLAPLAENLAELAPTAKEEYDYLAGLSSRLSLGSAEQRQQTQDAEMTAHRLQQSKRFFDLLQTPRGRPFAEAYRRTQALRRTALGTAVPAIELSEDALARAMSAGEIPRSAQELELGRPGDGGGYEEGTLAFVGYMLSYRWANLRSYYTAFSSHPEAIGVNQVLGSLVDFDRWLDCPPRSAHEDQMALHARMSQLSSGYMQPLIGYNPWTDVVENGRSLALVREAVTRHGFVGVKIYPPMGFRPWGNTREHDGAGRPSHEEINRRLEALWNTCLELDVPVMAHANASMGADDAHDSLGGPEGWTLLLAAYGAQGRSPRVNLGHFGGDGGSDWTPKFARLMGSPGGGRVFGDLGYWAELRCRDVGPARCQAAARRLKDVLTLPVGDGEVVADRLMFGSDWLMLSRETRWADYARELFIALRQEAPPGHVRKIFGENAARCFSRIARP